MKSVKINIGFRFFEQFNGCRHCSCCSAQLIVSCVLCVPRFLLCPTKLSWKKRQRRVLLKRENNRELTCTPESFLRMNEKLNQLYVAY